MDVPIRRIVPEATRTPAAKTETKNFPMPNWPGDEFPDGIFPAPALRLVLFVFLNWLHFLLYISAESSGIKNKSIILTIFLVHYNLENL